MDSLTQIVLGGSVGELSIGKKVGNWAIFWGAIGGTIPDLDIFARYFTDNITALEIHRGVSHSILFSVVMAPILGWIISKIHKNLSATWKDWTWLMFLALFTHPLLDAHTTWGTQLFFPFEYRLAYKNIFVVDPLYTLPFLGLLIATLFYNKTSLKRRKLNKIGLIISSSYMLLTFGLKWYTYQKFETSLTNQNISFVQIKTRPTPLNTILWSANIETEKGFIIGYYSLFDSQKEINFSKEIPKNHHLLDGMKNEKKIQQLIKISTGDYTISKQDNKLYFNDLRFGQVGIDNPNAPFIYSFDLNYQNGVFEATERPKSFSDGKAMLSSLFNRVKGN